MNKMIKLILTTFTAFALLSSTVFGKGLRIGVTSGLQFNAYGFSGDFQNLKGNDQVKADADSRGGLISSNAFTTPSAGWSNVNTLAGGTYATTNGLVSGTTFDADKGVANTSSVNTTNLNLGLNVSFDITSYLFVRSGIDFNTLLSGGKNDLTRSEYTSVVAGLASAAGTALSGGVNGGTTAAAGNSYCGINNAALNGLTCDNAYAATINSTTVSGLKGQSFKTASEFSGSFIRIPILVGLQVPLNKTVEIYGALGPSFYSGGFAYKTTIEASNEFLQLALSQTAGSEDKSSNLELDASGIGLTYILGARAGMGNNVDLGVEVQFDAFAKVASTKLGNTSDTTKSFDRSTANDLASVTKGTYQAGDATNEAEVYFPVSFSGVTVSFTAGYRIDM